MSPPTNNW